MAEDKALREKLAKLVASLREHQAKCYEITEEIDHLLGGGVGVGELLRRLELHWGQVWCGRYQLGGTLMKGGGYVWNYAKDRPQMKRLLRMLEVEEIERRMNRYLQNNDAFFTKGRHSFGMFVATVNQHAAPADALEAPPGCLHHPPCRDDVEHTKRRQRETNEAVL